MKQFAVIGDPIAHTLSPNLHQEVYRQLELDATFEQIHVTPNSLDSFINSNKLDGFNVTIPHKLSIIPFLKGFDEPAKTIGAVNCVHNGKGYNTDWIGFLKAMELNGVHLNGKDCTILGAGGAARAIAYGLVQADVNSILISNRTQTKADQLLDWINSIFPTNFQSKNSDIIINCTPIGMWPNTENLPININKIHTNQIIVDTIYNPIETEWIKLSRKKGAFTIGGLDMFIFQGIASAEIWENKILK